MPTKNVILRSEATKDLSEKILRFAQDDKVVAQDDKVVAQEDKVVAQDDKMAAQDYICQDIAVHTE